MNRIYFITGTDTGVGKTLVSTAMMAGLISAGVRALYHKPIQTGCRADQPDDTAWMLEHTGIDPAMTIPPRYRLALPASPACAARHENRPVEFDELVATIRDHARDDTTIVIEGAGGLLVPIDACHTMLDLITATGAAPIVVTRSTLGTLNHTGLTWQALTGADITPALLVVNDTAPVRTADERYVRDDNLVELERMAAPVPVVSMPFHAPITREIMARLGSELVQILIVCPDARVHF